MLEFLGDGRVFREDGRVCRIFKMRVAIAWQTYCEDVLTESPDLHLGFFRTIDGRIEKAAMVAQALPTTCLACIAGEGPTLPFPFDVLPMKATLKLRTPDVLSCGQLVSVSPSGEVVALTPKLSPMGTVQAVHADGTVDVRLTGF